MAKTRHAGIAALGCLLVVSTGWAATPSPSLIAVPPQPKWTELKVEQKIVLAPLSDDWDAMENYRQKKWLGIAARFFSLTPDEQRRIQTQMQEWDKLTPEERQAARDKFKTANQLPADKKQELKQKWEEYSSLPEKEKELLKQQAESKPVLKPTRPAATQQVPATGSLISPVATQLPAPEILPQPATATPAAPAAPATTPDETATPAASTPPPASEPNPLPISR